MKDAMKRAPAGYCFATLVLAANASPRAKQTVIQSTIDTDVWYLYSQS